ENIIENNNAIPATNITNEKMPIGNFNIMNETPFQVAGSVKNVFIFCSRERFGSVVVRDGGNEIPNRWVVCNLSNEMINQMVGNRKASMIRPTQMINNENPNENPTTRKTK